MHLPYSLMNWALIAITVLISIGGFSNDRVMNDLIFYPPAVRRGQWYRFFTYGLIHADVFHLLFNMYALYGFGAYVLGTFEQVLFPGYGQWIYLLFYIVGLPVSIFPTYSRHRNDSHYSSRGASGAVSAVIFAGIFLAPTAKIGIFLLPGIPGFIFGPLYLLISTILDRRGGGNINHSAHIWGALFGVVFIMIADKVAGAGLLESFIMQIRQFYSH